MDYTDSGILEALEKEGRLSDSELATMLGIDEDEIKQRISDLRERGILRGFGATVDWDAAGKDYVTAYIEVKVASQERTGFDQLCELIAANEKVQEVCVASGEYDLMVKIRVGSLREVGDFVTNVLATKKEVTATYTHFVLKKFKENGALFKRERADDKLVMSP